jgi:putative membrane protein
MDVLREISDIGYFLLIIAPLLLIIGIFRFFYVKRKLKKYFYAPED